MPTRLRSALPIFYGVAIAIIIFTSFWMGAGRKYLSLVNPHEDIVNLQRIEVDYHQLYPALEAKRTFAQSFNWWHEPWRADEWVGAYWRPLSMQVWWIESHLFGEDRSYSWMRVSLVVASLFDVLLFLFFWRLTRRRLFAVVGLALFALPGAWIHFITPLSVEPRISNADLLLVQGWKDQPDLFANCLTIGAMILAMKKRYGWSLFCAAVALCFKESGLLTFPLLLATVIYCGDLKALPKWIFGGVAAVLALYMLGRYAAGPMVFRFHTHGGDAGAFTRYTNAMLPYGVLSLPAFGDGVAGAGIFALLVWRPKHLLVWLISLICFFFVAVAVNSAELQVPMGVAFAQLLMQGLVPVALFVLWLCVMATLWIQRDYFLAGMFLAFCAFLAAVPFAMVTGALEHVLTISRSFQAGFGACAVFAVITFLLKQVKEDQKTRFLKKA